MVKACVIQASALDVLCPGCSEPLPNPSTGGDVWLPYEVAAMEGKEQKCNACDEPFVVRSVDRCAVAPGGTGARVVSRF